MTDTANPKNNSANDEQKIERRLNQEATIEKLKTPKTDIKNLKTLSDLLQEKR